MTISAEPSTPSGSAPPPQRRRQITSYKSTTSSPATDRSACRKEPCPAAGVWAYVLRCAIARHHAI